MIKASFCHFDDYWEGRKNLFGAGSNIANSGGGGCEDVKIL